jgi:DNA-binding SARP family transcriptional activator
MREDWHFRVLGPLQAEYRGESVGLGGLRQQTLLAMLLVDVNQVVHVERLIDAIWDGTPPPSARTQIRICVSGLRRLFALRRLYNAIETHPVGYRLRVDRACIDLCLFEDLLTRGRRAAEEHRPKEAVDLLRAALALWNGELVTGLESQRLRAVAAKYKEERLAAVEECMDLELQLGRHRQVAGELFGHVTDNSFREKMREQLMLALYRSGRQADALEEFSKARRLFSDELGIEPSENLRTLQQAILASDPTLHRLAGTARRSRRPCGS